MGRRERITHTEKIIYILLSQTETERAVGLGSLEFGAQFEKIIRLGGRIESRYGSAKCVAGGSETVHLEKIARTPV